MSKKVLMICYYYPPIGGIGSERPFHVSRLLPEFGWEPVVITPRLGTLYTIGAGEGMGEPPGVTVRRTPNPDLSFRFKRALGFDLSQRVESQLGGFAPRGQKPRGAKMRLLSAVKNWLEMPDRVIDWYPFVVREGLNAEREARFDALYSYCVPYTPALAAATISRRTGLPWLADLPDLWTRDFNYLRTGAAVRLDRFLEGRTLARADAIVAYADTCSAILRDAYPALAGRLHEIPNAFDGDLFDSVEPVAEPFFNVVYAGTLYYPYQDPRPFLEALKNLRGQGADLSSFRLQYMGRDGELLVKLASDHGVADLVQNLGQLDYAEALARQKGASALLYVQWEPAGETSASGKLMQYLGARRPVLAVVPTPGEADRLLDESGAGVVSRDAGEIVRVLCGWLEEHRASGSPAYRGKAGAIERFSYRSACGKLAGILDELSDHAGV